MLPDTNICKIKGSRNNFSCASVTSHEQNYMELMGRGLVLLYSKPLLRDVHLTIFLVLKMWSVTNQRDEVARVLNLRYCLLCTVQITLCLPAWKAKGYLTLFPSTAELRVQWFMAGCKPCIMWLWTLVEGKNVDYCSGFQKQKRKNILNRTKQAD